MTLGTSAPLPVPSERKFSSLAFVPSFIRVVVANFVLLQLLPYVITSPYRSANTIHKPFDMKGTRRSAWEVPVAVYLSV